MRHTGCIQVTVAASSREEADRLSAGIVEAGFAACAQVIGPITSTYRWRDGIEQASEYLLLFKTTGECFGDLRRYVHGHHRHQVPEVIATQIVDGGHDYLEWIQFNSHPLPRGEHD